MRLEGKVALVTGATRGIGAEIVRFYAREGAAVVFTGRSKEPGEAIQKQVTDAGGRALFVHGDAGNEADIRRAVDAAVDTFGSLTTLVNNAAATASSRSAADNPVEEMDNAILDEMFVTGVYGTLWACKYSIPHMKKAGGGSIINISASSSVSATPGRPVYQASKGAVNSLTRQTALEYGQFGIRSNTIAVGFVYNDGGSGAANGSPGAGDGANHPSQLMLADADFREGMKDWICLPRFGQTFDIANAALFLASDESSFITGVLLPVDGGTTSHQAIPPNFRRVLSGGSLAKTAG